MWLAKVKKRKLQFILTIFVLIAVSLILATCLAITRDVAAYVDDYYEDNREVLLFNPNFSETNQIQEYITNQGLTYDKTIGYNIERNVYHNGKNMSITLGYITVVSNINKNPWDIVIVEGKKKEKPKNNEIWVPKIFADDQGIKMGDTIMVKGENGNIDYKVTAFVNDSLNPTSIMGINNFFVNANISSVMEKGSEIQLVGYDCNKSIDKFTDEIVNYVGHSLQGTTMTKEAIRNVATISTVAIGGIGLIASLMVFFVAIIIIRFILWNGILKEYKSIGIYKALGFCARKIEGIYLKAYGITGVLALGIGSMVSIFISNYFVQRIVKYIGVYKYSSGSIKVVLGCFLILSFIYIVTLYCLLRRIRKIKPVVALTVGAMKSTSSLPRSLIHNSVSPVVLAINDIFKYRSQNLLIGLIFTVVSFLAIFFVNVDYAVANIDQNMSQWFGNMTGEFYIDTYDYMGSYKDIMKELQEDSRVSECRSGNYGVKSVLSIDTNKYKIKNKELVYCVYDNYAISEDFGCSVLKGRNPEQADEVALSNQILNDSEMKIGDSIQINVGGKLKTFKITGSFASIYNNSYCYRVLLDAIPEELRTMVPINIIVSLKNEESFNKLAQEIENKFDGTTVTKVPTDILRGLSDLDIISPIVKLILVSILFFSMLNIINIIVMNKTDNRKSYGIMKAVGFSCTAIILRTETRIAIISAVSMLLGLLLNVLFSDIIFKFAVMGVDGLIHSLSKDMVTVVIIWGLILVMTYLSLISIKKISTVELMEE